MEDSTPNFIGIYENVFPERYCEFLISEFERLNEIKGTMYNRKERDNAPKHRKDDLATELSVVTIPLLTFEDFEIPTRDIFFTGLNNCFKQYVNEFTMLEEIDLNCFNIKLQKTSPGGGYHIWHSEKWKDEQARYLTYTIYLNTLGSDAGGETEFLYYKKRVKPVVNTCMIFPTTFTHTHRGNTVLSTEDKYIATGWFHLN